MAEKKKKGSRAQASSLGTGAARGVANAMVKRQADIDRAASSTSSGSSRPDYSAKTSNTIDMSNPNAYRKYQLEQARKQVKKKK